MTDKPTLTLGWLYPELMSTYGDRGNILVLQKIAEDNGIKVNVVRINQTHDANLITDCDLLFMGGAQDLQQEIVNRDLIKNKGEILKEKIAMGTPGLYICGAYQFLGNHYKDAYGTTIPGLGVFDMYTESYKTKPRLIGNIVVKPQSSILNSPASTRNRTPILNLGENGSPTRSGQIPIPFVGFENHGGRTYLADKKQAFATVVRGSGNNGNDNTEGIIYKNSIGTYLHGPILPANPELACWLLSEAYKKKYLTEIEIQFNSLLAQKARKKVLERLKMSY